MTAHELCHKFQQERSEFYATMPRLTPYPEPGWDLLLDHEQRLVVLQSDSGYYTPCGDSEIDETQKALLAISASSLNWIEFANARVHVAEDADYSVPYLAWITTNWLDGKSYRIQRENYSSGLYMAYLFRQGTTWKKPIHGGSKTLDDAKLICLLHKESGGLD